MAIINNAHPGSQINLLCLIYRVIRRAKSSITVEQITDLCRPESLLWLKDHKKRFTDNLKFWANDPHKLWNIDSEKNIHLIYETKASNPSPYEIADVTRTALFEQELSNIMGDNKNDIESLLRTLACLMVSDRDLPYGDTYLSKGSLDKLVNEYLLPKHALNDSEKPTMLAYGHFLGMLEPQEDGYVVDPTRAITSVLSEIFNDEKILKISEFVEILGRYLPVLDGGKYRQQVIDTMIEKGWKPKGDKTLSRALSHALERLSIGQVLRLESISDDPHAMQIQLPTKLQTVSRLELIGTLN